MPTRLVLTPRAPARRRPVAVAIPLAAALLLPAAAAAQAGPARPPAAPAPVTGVTPARFAALRWLEGEWRGRAAGGAPFYERYRFLDDSTIQMSGFADSTLATRKDGDRIVLRGGTVRYENVRATRLDASRIDFAAPSGRVGFTWARAGRGADAGWTATLWQTDASGARRTTEYRMERYTPLPARAR